jgi:Protein of unknown function (DUF3891)
MIVRRDGEDLLLVRQADHALLSGWLAAGWGAPPWQAPEPRNSTIIGARLHDLAWTPFDEQLPRRPDGQPYAFFEVDRSTSTDFYLRGLDAVEAIDPYAGLLGSLHYSGFYTSHWGWQHWARPSSLEEPTKRFIAHELERQTRLRHQLGLGPTDERPLACNYLWLQMWDRISLDICRHGFSGFAEDYPAVPAGYAPDAETVRLRIELREGGVCRLDPYPLLPNPCHARIPCVRVPAGADLQRAWLSSGAETIDVGFEPL